MRLRDIGFKFYVFEFHILLSRKLRFHDLFVYYTRYAPLLRPSVDPIREKTAFWTCLSSNATEIKASDLSSDAHKLHPVMLFTILRILTASPLSTI